MNGFVKATITALCISSLPAVPAAEKNAPVESGYVARNENLRGLFDALASAINRPILLSRRSAEKKVSGEFDFTQPRLTLADITGQLGLIWYDDGSAIYVYDSGEMRNAVVMLQNATFEQLRDWLISAGLYDTRYPLKSDGSSPAFYVSGPPMYIDVVTQSARFLDQRDVGFDGKENVALLPLTHNFVADRQFTFRQQEMVIPGVASVLQKLLNVPPGEPLLLADPPAFNAEKMPASVAKIPEGGAEPLTEINGGMTIVASPGTNSLLVRGSAAQIRYIRRLVADIDRPRRHIELSVWIVDLHKDALDQLGLKWQGNLNLGGRVGITFNNGVSTTIDGASFMASAVALSEKKLANIVSRPMILTQENIPAVFDHNRTFYSKLIGERSAELKNVTWGTSVSVLPRFTRQNEVEMMINVEDGNQFNPTGVDRLPEVGRTTISTIARVPQGKSLLIGGSVVDQNQRIQSEIPLLGRLPLVGGLFRWRSQNSTSVIRMFLIQPREINPLSAVTAQQTIKQVVNDREHLQLTDWIANYSGGQ